MNTTVWIILFILLTGYAVITAILYVVSIRPRLRQLDASRISSPPGVGTGGGAAGTESVPRETTRPVLQRSSDTFDEIAEHVQAIKRAGCRAKDLVTQILAFSRPPTNQRRNLLIAPVVKESCRLLRASLPATIELKVSVAQDIGMIKPTPARSGRW